MADQKFKVVIPGVDGGGAQVFEADSQEELTEKLRSAQENATAKIRELAQQNEQLNQQVEQLTPQQTKQAEANGFDRQTYFNLLYQNPLEAQKYVTQFMLGVPIENFMQDYNKTRAGAARAIENETTAAFAQKHPELLQVGQEEDKHNGAAIAKILTENGWEYNLNNLEAAYAVARTNGQLKLNQMDFAPEVTLPSVPTTISRPTGQFNNKEAEEEFLRTAPLPKVREYLEKQHGQR